MEIVITSFKYQLSMLGCHPDGSQRDVKYQPAMWAGKPRQCARLRLHHVSVSGPGLRLPATILGPCRGNVFFSHVAAVFPVFWRIFPWNYSFIIMIMTLFYYEFAYRIQERSNNHKCAFSVFLGILSKFGPRRFGDTTFYRPFLYNL